MTKVNAQRARQMGCGLSVCFLLVHVTMLLLFRQYGVTPMVWFNAFSIVFYLLFLFCQAQNQEISGFNKHFYLVNFCQTEPDWDEQSSHFMQNSLQRVWQAKHPACPNIKACPPLSTMMVNLPCLWGSVSQLPSSHLFIHRVPAKLSNGVMLHGRNPCRLQLLFVL